MAKKKQSGNVLLKMASWLPDRMLSKLMMKYILKGKVDLTDESYKRDFKNISLNVNWDICGIIGSQIFELENYSYKYGELLEDPDISIFIESMEFLKKSLRGEELEPFMGRDDNNDFVVSHIYAWDILETEHGPRRTPLKKTFLKAKIKDPNIHPLVITKIPFLRSFEKQRDEEVDGEEYGAYIPINLSVGKYENDVIPYMVFDHFIEKASNIVIHKCGCREHYKCEKHPYELGCMYLGDDTLDMVIPADRGRKATKEEARERVRTAIDQGLIPLMGRDMGEIEAYGVKDTGHVLSACFCCDCCCIQGKAITHGSSALNGTIAQRIQGLEITVDESKCDGCGKCLDVCVFKGREVLDGKAHVDPHFCLGCGRCVDVCPQGAISITLEDPSYVDKLIAKIESIADVTPQSE